jgi:hypothetical protein
MAMKNMDDVMDTMSTLYDRLDKDEIDRVKASELSNIAGKFLKAEQLKLAREVFQDSLAYRMRFTPPLQTPPVNNPKAVRKIRRVA